MRRLGYWVVDRTIEHLATLRDQHAILETDSATLTTALGGPAPREGRALESELALLADVALAHEQHGDHPRYFARVASPSSFPAILGEWLGTGLSSVASSWGGGSGPTTVELTVLEWLRDALGLDPRCEGVMQSGGSLANVTALMCARQEMGEGVIYLSNQTHSSIGRGLPAMGHPDHLVRKVPTDEHFRLTADQVRAAVETDVAAGLRPTIVVATAGSTNTGAVDEIDAIADVCAQFGIWLHVDGAYGGPASLTPAAGALFTGIERADSFVIDPHKWLFQPYDIACVFVARPGALERTFSMNPEYLADLHGSNVDLHNRSLELSRRSRAMKLWLTLRYYGLNTITDAISRGIALAEYAQFVVESTPGLDVVTPAQLGIINFAAHGRSDADHLRAIAALNADGFAGTSSTVLNGRTVFRLCIINPATTTEDLDGTIARLAEYVRP
jgi:glutamate/tyrosine decarboxylase-like PLP-dependent enzyme